VLERAQEAAISRSISEQRQRAERLLALHSGGKLLLLPNVWDPLGARILAAKGFPAVATASAAISASLGYRDGEQIRRSTLLEILHRIARGVEVPVSADFEAGYGATLDELEDSIRAVIEAGVVGINLEDSLEEGGALRATDEQCARIARVREVSARLGVPLVLNARIDTFLSSSFAGREAALEEAVARARAYAAAGADCVYPVGPGDEATVRELRARIAAPINILGSPAAAPLALLESIGVDRVSFGPYVFRTLVRRFVEIAESLTERGDASPLREPLSKEGIQEYLREGPEPPGEG